MAEEAAPAYTAPAPTAVLHVKRTFAAPRERVFRAWTDPEAVVRWFGPRLGGPKEVEADLRVGGRYKITMQTPVSRRPVLAMGTYLEVSPPERLVYTMNWRGMPLAYGMGDSRVTVAFRELGEETEVSLTHELLDKARIRGYHSFGWWFSMPRLAKLLDRDLAALS